MSEGTVRGVRTRQRPPDRTLNRDEGTVVVNRTMFGDETQTIEQVRVPTFAVDPARIKVAGSITRNMGDMNFVRVEVSLEMPCLPELSEAERVYAMTAAWVDERMRLELENATTSRGPSGGEQTGTNEAEAQREAAGISPIETSDRNVQI